MQVQAALDAARKAGHTERRPIEASPIRTIHARTRHLTPDSTNAVAVIDIVLLVLR